MVCFVMTGIIHFFFSYPTQNTWIPDPFFSIILVNIHNCKHGSDSEVYDTEGRFVHVKFEELWSKYSSAGDVMTWQEGVAMTEAARNVGDVFGGIAAKLEWGFFWILVQKNGGRVGKEDVRRQYDGSLFYDIEKKKMK